MRKKCTHTLQPLSSITASELKSRTMQVNLHLIPPFSGATSSLTAGVTLPAGLPTQAGVSRYYASGEMPTLALQVVNCMYCTYTCPSPNTTSGTNNPHCKCPTHWDQPPRPSCPLSVLHCMWSQRPRDQWGQLPHCKRTEPFMQVNLIAPHYKTS